MNKELEKQCEEHIFKRLLEKKEELKEVGCNFFYLKCLAYTYLISYSFEIGKSEMNLVTAWTITDKAVETFKAYVDMREELSK